MNADEPIHEVMLLYVAGMADADETASIEAMLCAAVPHAVAAHAEAHAIYHAMALDLDHVAPPDACRHDLLGRVALDVSNTAKPANAGSMSIGRPSARGAGAPLRWPLYAATAMAACLAVALSASLWNGRQMERRYSVASADLSQVQDNLKQVSARYGNAAATLAQAQEVLRSPHVTLASLETKDAVGSGRVLYCPVTKQYQVTVFNLKPLPPGRAYELWLITPDQKKVPCGVFEVDDHGTATFTAHPDQAVSIAAVAAITDEPASGSQQPTGSIHLAGALASGT